jgi:hypothetical protein
VRPYHGRIESSSTDRIDRLDLWSMAVRAAAHREPHVLEPHVTETPRMSDPESPLREAHLAPLRATARLPHLDIEITHRRAPDGDAEQISISVRAVPTFEAWGRLLEATNPLAFWAQAAWLPWLPWLSAVAAALPAPEASAQPPARATPRRPAY